MTRNEILAELKAERNRLNAAIAALEGGRAKPRKRPRSASGRSGRPRRRWTMSPEARRKISKAKKAWWAKRKKGVRG